MNSHWIVETLVSSTLLMLVVLAVRQPVARWLGAQVAYALWALPVLRMLLPPLPGWTTLYVPVAHAQPLTVGIVDPVTAAGLAVTDLPVAAVAPQLLVPLLVGLWAVGAVVWFGWQMWRYRRFLHGALADAELLTRVRSVDVLITRAVAGPMAAGIVRRRILLPADFTRRYSAEERRLALLHEGAHHDRGDLIANFAGLVVVAAHWWNPVAHIAYRAFRSDQELACDATVLAGAEAGTRAAYGSAVLKSACSRTPTVACAMNHKSQLKQRIAMMKSGNSGAARTAIGAVFAAAMIGGGLLLSASGAAAAPPVAPVPPVAPIDAVPAVPPAPPAPAAPAPPWKPHASHRVVVRDGVVIHNEKLSAADERAVREAGRGAERDARAAERDARAAEREVRRAGQQARIAGEKAGSAARIEAAATVRAMDIQDNVQRSLAVSRASMAARCSAAGVAVSANADIGALAVCNHGFEASIKTSVRESLKAVRYQIAGRSDLTDDARRHALDGLDRAISHVDRPMS